MFYVLQNESTASLRRVPILLTDAATGTSAQTGIALTTIFPYVNINGGAFIGGTGSVGEAGFGQYYYQMAPGETNTLGLAGIHITAAGCRAYDAIAQIAAFNVYSSAGLGLTAGDVWSYVLSDSNTADTNLVAAAAGGGGVTAGDVWSYDISAIGSPSAGYALQNTYVPVSNNLDVQLSTIPSTTATDVWNVSLGSNVGNEAGKLLYDSGTGSTGYVNAAPEVWSYATRTLTSGGGGATAGDIWNYTLLSSGQSADTTLGNADDQATNAATNTNSPTLEANIWSYASRTITGGAVTSVVDPVSLTNGSFASIASSVWSTLTAPYTVHGTYGHQVLRSDNAATIGEVTLHQSGGSKRVDADVHAFVNNTASATAMLNILTGIGASITSNITGSLSGSVGSVTGNVGGNVVGSVASVTAPVTVATASMTGIAGTVWSVASRTITGGTITTVSDKTGYSLSGTQSFNLTGNITGNLSGSVGSVSGSVASVTAPVTVASASMTGIAGTVWSTNISGYSAGTAGNALLNAGGGGVAVTAGDIWTYASRTLTSSTGATAGDVWSYVDRTLTSGSGITVIGAVQLVNGPYRLTSNQNNSDGILDILQNSVQEINLNLIDGNGSPASTAGYGAVINIYDVAGAAVTAYTPVVEYADGGILSFELDTDVTSTIGRYNLIVALSGAGFNVKYGPLQILVRPL